MSVPLVVLLVDIHCFDMYIFWHNTPLYNASYFLSPISVSKHGSFTFHAHRSVVFCVLLLFSESYRRVGVSLYKK